MRSRAGDPPAVSPERRYSPLGEPPDTIGSSRSPPDSAAAHQDHLPLLAARPYRNRARRFFCHADKEIGALPGEQRAGAGRPCAGARDRNSDIDDPRFLQRGRRSTKAMGRPTAAPVRIDPADTRVGRTLPSPLGLCPADRRGPWRCRSARSWPTRGCGCRQSGASRRLPSRTPTFCSRSGYCGDGIKRLPRRLASRGARC